jgi:hypothetical protein
MIGTYRLSVISRKEQVNRNLVSALPLYASIQFHGVLRIFHE